MAHIADPREMNATFARLFNERKLDGLLSLYEQDAAHYNGRSLTTDVGLPAIGRALQELLALPGRMTSVNNVCLVAGELALLRADWVISDEHGRALAQGSSMEIARRQADGGWKTVIDHALGASLPALELDPSRPYLDEDRARRATAARSSTRE